MKDNTIKITYIRKVRVLILLNERFSVIGTKESFLYTVLLVYPNKYSKCELTIIFWYHSLFWNWNVACSENDRIVVSYLSTHECFLFLFQIHAQYRPNYPSPYLQREIFVLNLEDGFFGCQVNESVDILQLFELSKLCDGIPQCFLGSDEVANELKCTDRSEYILLKI